MVLCEGENRSEVLHSSNIVDTRSAGDQPESIQMGSNSDTPLGEFLRFFLEMLAIGVVLYLTIYVSLALLFPLALRAVDYLKQ